MFFVWLLVGIRVVQPGRRVSAWQKPSDERMSTRTSTGLRIMAKEIRMVSEMEYRSPD